MYIMKSKALKLPASLVRQPVLFSAVCLLLAGWSQARAAVINAASGSFVNVSNAVAHAAPGDTVLIPAGTNGWASELTIGSITLQGAGAGSTVIMDETPIVSSGSGTPILQLSATSNVPTRVTQIQFAHGVGNNITTFPNNYGAEIVVYGQNPNWRIDHCAFNVMSGKTIRLGDDAFGLIDHNAFTTFDRISIEVFGSGYGDVDWAAPTQFGSANALYIEDNTFVDGNNFGWVDVSSGGRAVFRHNTCNGFYFNTHGSETSQRYRSARYVEVYNNSFSYAVGQQYQNFYTMVDVRGGSAVVFSNTAVGYWSVTSLNYYRATDNDTGFFPWFGATGLRAWDSNSPALLTGTASASAATNVLVVAGANWTTNQWVGCTVYNNVNALCGIVTANDSSSMQFMGSRRAWLQLGFTAGDTFTVHKVYPMLDQPGRGQSDSLSGDSPTPVWLHEASEPVYIWGNQRSVNYNVLTAQPATVGSQYPNIQLNRDFFNDIPRPNYSPYTYPHPLTLLTNAVANTNTVPAPPTNSIPATNNLAPPTGLNVRPL
jgi:hypothetical protein